MKLCLVNSPALDWADVISLCENELKGRSLKSLICKLSIGAVAYKLWSRRNDIKHGKSIKSEEKLVKQVIWEVRTRV